MTGSNPSLFESKKITPGEDIGVSGAQFLGHIIGRVTTGKRVATVTFINECNCLTTREWAIKLKVSKEIYCVESPVFLKQSEHGIDDVFYKGADDDVAAYWGVVKVSYKI